MLRRFAKGQYGDGSDWKRPSEFDSDAFGSDYTGIALLETKGQA